MSIDPDDDLRKGALSTPMYASEQLQWLTDEGTHFKYISSQNDMLILGKFGYITEIGCSSQSSN